MLGKLKADFDGILELVQKCPTNLQETAFKVILEPGAPFKPSFGLSGVVRLVARVPIDGRAPGFALQLG